MKLKTYNEIHIETINEEISRLKREIKGTWVFFGSVQIMLVILLYFGRELFDQLYISGILLFDTCFLIYNVAGTLIVRNVIFDLKRKIVNLQENNFDTTNEFNKNGTGTTSAAVYVNKRSKSDGNKVDEESKRRVFNQNSNVIINSSQPTNTESRKQGNAEIKKKKIVSNDDTSNTTQVALGVALSVATTTSAFQNDTTSLGCGSSGDGGGDCGGFN
jgi:hypothetical protein